MKAKASYRIFSVFFGTFLTAFGIVLLLKSNLGTDTLSVFITGLQEHIPLAFGYISMLINLVIIVIALLIQRDLIGVGTVINGFGIGFVVNILSSLLANWQPSYGWLLSLAGAVFYAFGIGFYVSAGLGAAAIECLSFIIDSRSKLSLKVIRIGLDAVLVIMGLLLGSKGFNFGTLICLLLTGPTVEWMLKRQMNRNS